MSGQIELADKSQVLIPSDLHGEFRDFFFRLQKRARDLAVQQAVERTPGGETCCILPEEFATAIQQAMKDAVDEVNQTFTSQNRQHVRRAS